jgi:hypothetical protein
MSRLDEVARQIAEGSAAPPARRARAKAILYSATTPDGRTFTRSSHRIYTHAVVAQDRAVYRLGADGRYEWEPIADPAWYIAGFAGSVALAQKRATSLAAKPWVGRAVVVPVGNAGTVTPATAADPTCPFCPCKPCRGARRSRGKRREACLGGCPCYDCRGK